MVSVFIRVHPWPIAFSAFRTRLFPRVRRSNLLRWPSPDRSTCPSKARSVRGSPPARAACGSTPAAPPGSSLHGGIVISPRRRRFGHARTASISAGTPLGSTPCLVSSSLSLTSSITSRARPASFKPPRQLCRIHGLHYLEQLRGPCGLVGLQMPDQVKAAPRKARSRGEPCLRTPARSFRRTRAAPGRRPPESLPAGKILVTASSRICAGSRRARPAARSIRARTAASLSASPSMAVFTFQYPMCRSVLVRPPLLRRAK